MKKKSEDERIPGKNALRDTGNRRIGHTGSMSGGDDAVYHEFRKSLIAKDPSDGDCFLIELQGDLRSLSNSDKEFHDDKFIGDLHYTKKRGQPILIIGNHLLKGREVKLENPIGVLEKTSKNNNEEQITEYLVRRIIKRKIIFKTRPVPIDVECE